MEIERVSGAAILRSPARARASTEPLLDALARLRIAVFREYPYLYDGTLAYEQRYLLEFSRSPRSTLVVARDGSEIVGAATATPLLDHGEADVLAPPLRAAGYDPERFYYFGESVLLPAYRGRGIGHAFFDQREAAARTQGFPWALFCAVERAPDHPRKPPGYVPHDAFWTRRGYVRRPELMATFSWRDLDEPDESEKRMTFWLKELEP